MAKFDPASAAKNGTASISSMLNKPGNFFLIAGGLLILAADSIFDGFLGTTLASIGIWYLFN